MFFYWNIISSAVHETFDLFQNLQPDSQYYVVMADVAVKGKDRNRAYKYVKEAEKRGLKASPEAFEYANGNNTVVSH